MRRILARSLPEGSGHVGVAVRNAGRSTQAASCREMQRNDHASEQCREGNAVSRLDFEIAGVMAQTSSAKIERIR